MSQSSVKLKIYFDNTSATYYSGDSVSGRILVCNEYPREFQGISICLKGYADVKWSESSGSDTSYYKSHEEYFHHKLFVLGDERGGRITLPAGEHSFPFQMILPPNLPSSFVGSVGYVRYSVEGVLSRPWKFDKKCLAVFTVLSPLDLSLYPEAQFPVKVSKVKSYCCCCIALRGKSNLVVSLPRSDFSPLQEIPVTIEFDNTSSMDITDIVCTLRKNVLYRATNKIKTDTTNVVSVDVGSVSQQSSKTWTTSLLIPELPPVNLTHCKIMDLLYTICIDAKTPAFHKNIAMAIPLVIVTL